MATSKPKAISYAISAVGADGSLLSGTLTLANAVAAASILRMTNTNAVASDLAGNLTVTPKGAAPANGLAFYDDAGNEYLGAIAPGTIAPAETPASGTGFGAATINGVAMGGKVWKTTPAAAPANPPANAPPATNAPPSTNNPPTTTNPPPAVSPVEPPPAATGIAPVPVITMTSPSGLLPIEPVIVHAMQSSWGDSDALHCLVNWDFGDAGSEYDSSLQGRTAGHIYRAAGAYTITCTIVTPSGASAKTTATVTIGEDNRLADLVSGNLPAAASGGKYLLTRGQKYPWSSVNGAFNVAGLEHMYIGATGSGAPPVIYYDGPAQANIAAIQYSKTSSNIVIEDIEFDSSIVPTTTNALPDGADLAGNNLALIGCTFGNVANGVNLNQQPTNVLIQDSASASATCVQQYFAWVQATNVVLIGNTSTGSVLPQANFRFGGTGAGDAAGGSENVLFAFNNVAQSVAFGDAFKNTVSVQAVENGDFVMNRLGNGPISLGPIGTDGTTSDSTWGCVVRSNVLSDGQLHVGPQALNCLLNNNARLSSAKCPYESLVSIDATQGGATPWVVNGLEISNNVEFTLNPASQLLQIQEGQAIAVKLLNNVIVGNGITLNYNGPAYVVNSNPDWSSFVEIKGNLYGPATIGQFQQSGVFYAGTAPQVQADYLTEAKWLALGFDQPGTINVPVVFDVASYRATVAGVIAGSTLARGN